MAGGWVDRLMVHDLLDLLEDVRDGRRTSGTPTAAAATWPGVAPTGSGSSK